MLGCGTEMRVTVLDSQIPHDWMWHFSVLVKLNCMNILEKSLHVLRKERWLMGKFIIVNPIKDMVIFFLQKMVIARPFCDWNIVFHWLALASMLSKVFCMQTSPPVFAETLWTELNIVQPLTDASMSEGLQHPQSSVQGIRWGQLKEGKLETTLFRFANFSWASTIYNSCLI